MGRGRETLLSIRFTRETVEQPDGKWTINYILQKDTPFGLLDATCVVSFEQFEEQGALKQDASTYRVLSEKLNREEMDLITESAANTQFGVKEKVS